MFFFIKEPVERVLGRVNTQTARGTTLQRESCYDIPLLQSLQSLLLCDTVVEQVTLSYMYVCDRLMTSFLSRYFVLTLAHS